MRYKHLLILLALVALLAAGCRQADNTPAPAPQQPKQEEQQQKDPTEAIREEWAKSAHATATNADAEDSPAKRDNCIRCHNGKAYAMQISTADEVDTGKPVGQDCETCHSGHGKEVKESGLVQLPAGEVRDGGGVLCMDCHNARNTPDPDKRPAPHASAQSDVVMGMNGYQAEGKTYSSSPHTAAKDTCLGCHMANLDGHPSHTFKADVEACKSCHQGMDSINRKAQADYDGDGNVEGFQEEIDGLLKMLHDAIEAKLNGGTFTTGHGQILFQDANQNELDNVPAELYYGAWNYFLVSNDGSKGIHNPTYAVQLLQQSILMLDGDLGKAQQL